MRDNFEASYQETLKWEGGLSNHPKDPGGLTNRGVTQDVYDSYRDVVGEDRRSVTEITDEEVEAVYRHNYWKRINGDMLPLGVDFVVYDYAVNSGCARSVKDLQRGLGVPVDGVVGGLTLSKLKTALPDTVIEDLCARRLRYLKSLKIWSTFGRGWARRVAGVRTTGLEMVNHAPMTAVAPVPAPAKAPPSSVAVTRTAEGTGLTISSAGGVGQTLMTKANELQPHFNDTMIGRMFVSLFFFLMVLGGCLVGYSLIGRIKEAGGLGGFVGSVFNR